MVIYNQRRKYLKFVQVRKSSNKNMQINNKMKCARRELQGLWMLHEILMLPSKINTSLSTDKSWD